MQEIHVKAELMQAKALRARMVDLAAQLEASAKNVQEKISAASEHFEKVVEKAQRITDKPEDLLRQPVRPVKAEENALNQMDEKLWW